jgi:hypothetical protein
MHSCVAGTLATSIHFRSLDDAATNTGKIMQVVDLDGLHGVELPVQVKWCFGALATQERLALLKHATPYMLDLARQIVGCEATVRVKRAQLASPSAFLCSTLLCGCTADALAGILPFPGSADSAGA